MQEGESYLLFLTAYDRDSVYAGMYFPTELEKGKYPLTDEPLTASDSADAWEVYVIEGRRPARLSELVSADHRPVSGAVLTTPSPLYMIM